MLQAQKILTRRLKIQRSPTKETECLRVFQEEVQQTNLLCSRLLLVHWPLHLKSKKKHQPYPKKTFCTIFCCNQMRISIWTPISLPFSPKKPLNSNKLRGLGKLTQTNRSRWFVIPTRHQLFSSPTKKIGMSVSSALFPAKNCFILIKVTKQKWNTLSKSNLLLCRPSSQTK